MIEKVEILSFIFLAFILWTGCESDAPSKSSETGQSEEKPLSIPSFDRDSALYFVEKQLSFGPRVPGTEAHSRCADYLRATLEKYGAEVQTQSFKGTFYTGEAFRGKNIIASFYPQYNKRILLCAHWDTRFEATEETDPELRKKPIPGADDGASGVAVLLEIARQLSRGSLDMGVDIILFDGEDQGKDGGQNSLSWCQGSQYWSNNPHKSGYQAQYGILLDMVGSKEARFAKEGFSMKYAPEIMNEVWSLAQRMSYGNYFLDKGEQGVMDDHYFINRQANIPTINIINRTPGTESGFGSYWHTHQDNIDNISKHTLKAVGQVVLATLYHESRGSI